MKPTRSWLIALASIASVGMTQASAAQPQRGNIKVGETYARTNCAMCHAIGRFGDSPLRIAPPFRELHKRYPVEDLAEALGEGIRTGHPSMPEFRLDPDQVENLIAYLKTLER